MSDKSETEIQADAPSVKVSMALCATPVAWSSIHNVIRKLNRDMTLVATGLLGTVISAAVVLAFLGRDPKAEGSQRERDERLANFCRVPIRLRPKCHGFERKESW